MTEPQNKVIAVQDGPFYWHDERQWTLGQFIDALEAVDPSAWVRFDRKRKADYGKNDNGVYPGRFVSHRGDYSHVSLERVLTPPMVAGDLLGRAKEALGREFQGWKGGEYRMYRSTPLWAEHYGDCYNVAVVGVKRMRHGGVVIQTAVIEEE